MMLKARFARAIPSSGGRSSKSRFKDYLYLGIAARVMLLPVSLDGCRVTCLVRLLVNCKLISTGTGTGTGDLMLNAE